MAVVSFKEIHDGRDGESSSEQGGKSTRTYTRVFRVKTNSNYDEAATVRAVCPRIGYRYPYDIAAVCRRVRARNEGFSKIVWIVTCSYSTGNEIEENPTADPVEIEWSAETFQRPYFADTEGHLICNKAGDYFDPPVEGDDCRWTVTIKKNMLAVPTWLLTYRNSVNAAAFVLDGVAIAARCAKLSSIRVSAWQDRNDIKFRGVTLTMHLNEATWDKPIWNSGLYQKLFLRPEARRPCIDDKGQPVKIPVSLDNNGYQLSNPSPTNAVWLTFKIYKEKDFTVLPLT